MIEIVKTPEQEAKLDEIMARRSILNRPIDKDRFEWGLRQLYADIGLKLPKVYYAPDPYAALEMAAEALNEEKPGDIKEYIKEAYQNTLFTCWTPGRAAFVEACEVVNIDIDKDVAETIKALGEQIGLIVTYAEAAFVSENCVGFYVDEEGEMHNENGPAWHWENNIEVYAINGVIVDKQTVMAPKTQTLEQIGNEQNAEWKRIRISRYGWEDYLTEANAKLVDVSTINLGSVSWIENLMKLDDMTVLCTYDPSTGRPYSLEVSNDCTTCAQAQAYLKNNQAAFEGFKTKPDSKLIYPVLRT